MCSQNGNITSDGTKTYVWNALNQLVEVKQGLAAINCETRPKERAGFNAPPSLITDC